MITISAGYYLIITTVLLLHEVTGLGFGHGHFQKDQSKETDKLGFQAKMFEQKLDHFNPNDNRTWGQRYYFNSYETNYTHDIAFIKIGGREQAKITDVYDGAFAYYATNFNPKLFSLEHRYYGLSFPTDDMSTENLKYLSSRQALADLKYFIEYMSKHFNMTSDVKWVAFGHDYGGSLAVWARQQYPDLIYAAVASSAPLLAKVDFNEYYPIVADTYGSVDKQCPGLFRESFRQLEELIADPEKFTQINDIFHLCTKLEDSIDKPLDISTFFYNIIIFFDTLSVNPGASYTINGVCNKLSNESAGSLLERLHAAWYEGYTFCNDIRFNELVQTYIGMEESEFFAYRNWMYQGCTEFGFFPTTTHEPYYFGHHLDVNFYVERCKNVFRPEFDRTYVENAVASTNALYHGLDINVTNTIFITGSLDPWYALEITESRSEDAPVIVIEGGAHSSDIKAPSDDDPLPLKQAHAKVEEYLSKWLNQ